jgi:hypothetical protein
MCCQRVRSWKLPAIEKNSSGEGDRFVRLTRVTGSHVAQALWHRLPEGPPSR